MNGGNLSGDVTIRVYNDDIVEGDETITLDYTLNANGGDALPGTNNQTVTITINDDDFAPGNMPSGVDITLLSQDFESGWQGFVSTNNAGGAGNDPWQIGDVATASSTAYAIPAHGGNFAWLNDDACDCDQNDVDLDFPIVDLTGYIQANLTFDSYFEDNTCLLYTSPSPRDLSTSRMPSSA